MEPKLKDVVVELASEAPLVAVLPLLVDNLEGDVLVGRPRGYPQDHKLTIWGWRHFESRRFSLVDEVRIEDVEFVALMEKKGNGHSHKNKLFTWTIFGGGLSKS